MTLAHLLKLLLFLELLTTTALSAVLLQYLDQPWYWVLLYVPSFFFLVTSKFTPIICILRSTVSRTRNNGYSRPGHCFL